MNDTNATPEGQATRIRILEAAVEEIAEHGPDRATAKQIARRAGLTQRAIWGRWRNKDELIAAVQEHCRSLIETDALDDAYSRAVAVMNLSLDPGAASAYWRIMVPKDHRASDAVPEVAEHG